MSVLAASLWLAPSVAAATFEWVTVGDPGNDCDDEVLDCFGRVDYVYRISKYEVTNAQYAEFLNAKAASDPLELFNTFMTDFGGGITRNGSPGSYTYSTIPGRESRPVIYLSYFDALRFANWLHNGQGYGDTETGAYTLMGGTPTPSNTFVERNPEATIFIPTENEWYKAAYYDPASGAYYQYPAGTDTQIVCSAPTATPNTANCGPVLPDLTNVGSYPGSPSPNGTFDQGGNVEEWIDAIVFLDHRALRAGGAHTPADRLGREIRNYDEPSYEAYGVRVAAIANGVICGDAICEGGENPINCAVDCPDVCGDGLCTGSEDLQTCAADCACGTHSDCDDGAFCNGIELCSGGGCQAGAPVDCADGVGCTADTCNEATDSCNHAPMDVVCDDGVFCNGVETCDPTLGCQAGPAVPCDDGVSCTSDSCSNVTHMCTHTPVHAVCNNGLFCDGAETCHATLDCQAGGNPCPGQSCNETNDTCVGSSEVWLSFIDSASVPGVGTVQNEDIVTRNVSSGAWSMVFDGSDVGLSGFTIDGMARMANGNILLSFTASGSVPGMTGGPSGTTLDDSDIVRFAPTTLGTNTAGSFVFYFDGSDVGLTSDDEDIDAIVLTSSGQLAISTIGAVSAAGASGADTDLLLFNSTSLGSATAGSLSVYFDGSDVGLSDNGNEDVDAAAIRSDGAILLSTIGNFSVPGVAGANEDIVRFSPTALGSATSGAYSMYLDLSALGIATSEDVGSVHLVE